MKEKYLIIPVDEQSLNKEDLLNAAVETGKKLKELVDYVEEEFKVSRFKATVVVAAVIDSVQHQIENDKDARNDIQEILSKLSDSKR